MPSLIKKIHIPKRRVVTAKDHKQFLTFLEKNKAFLARCIYVTSANLPPSLSYFDNRWLISRFMSHTFIKHLRKGQHARLFQDIQNEHYDLLYNGGTNISVKVSQDVFEREGLRKARTKPKPVILKNCLGAKSIRGDDWHYLLVIQRQNEKRNIYTSFGAISYRKVKNRTDKQVQENKKGDQVIVTLQNKDYDYFYQHNMFFPEYTKEEKHLLDVQLHNHLCFMGDSLMENNRININSI